MKFLVVYDKAPNNYCALVPGLPVICISTGDTVEEIQQNIREAMDGHIELMMLDGDPLSEPKIWSEDMKVQLQEGDPIQKFTVTFEESSINCAAFIPGVHGCVSVGDTIHEVRQNIRKAIEFQRDGMAVEEAQPSEPSSWAEVVEVILPVSTEAARASGA